MKEIKAFESIDEIMKDYEGWEINFGVFFSYYMAYDEYNKCWYAYKYKDKDMYIWQDNIKDPECEYERISLLTNYKGEPSKNYKGEQEYGCWKSDEEFSYWGHVDEFFKEHITEDYDLECYLCDYLNAETYIDEQSKTIEIYYYE